MILRRADEIEVCDSIQFESCYPPQTVVKVVKDADYTKLYLNQNSSVLPHIKLRNADYIEVTNIPKSYDKE